jgi:adenylosuccinate lyase
MFDSPIGNRYSHKSLEKIWSSTYKIKLMRDLWTNLAIFQKQLGVSSIKIEGIEEMKMKQDIINNDTIDKFEEMFKHDIVANIHAFGELCPNAKSFIHLGATSNFINDNVDLIRMKSALCIIKNELNVLFTTLKNLSLEYIEVPTLAYTHLQKAQVTTVGKRFTMWNSDIVIDLDEINNLIDTLPFKGIKGTVGTEDSILQLLQTPDKCNELNNLLRNHYKFDKSINICGQTYSRKYDVKVVQCLANIAQTLYKIASDFRLLSSKMELLENFSAEQVGSSAMPYKKNPITCEKVCSLTRYIMNNQNNITNTYINQWLERTLDDSSIKRIVLPEMFVLLGYTITQTTMYLSTCVVNEDVIKLNIKEHMDNIISEKIIIEGVKLGYNRQDIHEKLRNCQTNNLSMYDDAIIKYIIERAFIIKDPIKYIGLSIEQVNDFYKNTKFD